MPTEYHLYILSSRSRVLYIGVTRDLARRLAQHRSGEGCEFTAKYKCTELVYAESFALLMEAVRREKQIKNWSRAKKEKLIRVANPLWQDLGG